MNNKIALKILSGGQTGVDRAALDVALSLKIPHGGWCPKGRRAEDGRLDRKYQLTETDERDYAVRTEQNVIDSDATLILFRDQLTGGTRLTRQLASRHEKPQMRVDLQRADSDQQLDIAKSTFDKWLDQNAINILNIAGPRESTSPGIYAQAMTFLRFLILDFAA